MRKIGREERQEIQDFFRSRGERCIKIIPLSVDDSRTFHLHCTVITHSGKKETAYVRIQKSEPVDERVHAGCAF